MYKTWKNMDKASIVKGVIEDNFKTIWEQMPNNVKCVSTLQRLSMSTDHLSDGLIVYDTTQNKRYRYKNGAWEIYPESLTLEISVGDWVDGKISISHIDHKITSPTVNLFMSAGDDFCPVFGGVYINADGDITLKSDLAFNGKVVIK